jgi:hypothetical protein
MSDSILSNLLLFWVHNCRIVVTITEIGRCFCTLHDLGPHSYLWMFRVKPVDWQQWKPEACGFWVGKVIHKWSEWTTTDKSCNYTLVQVWFDLRPPIHPRSCSVFLSSKMSFWLKGTSLCNPLEGCLGSIGEMHFGSWFFAAELLSIVADCPGLQNS